MGTTVAGTVSAAVFPQQGLFFPQDCSAQHQDDVFGGPAATDCFYVTVQLLSVWRMHIQADSGSQYMGSALAPVLCTLVASSTEFLWLHNFCMLLYVMRIIVLFTFRSS